MRKGLRAATGGGIYDMMDAQASRQDSSVQARNREEQPYPGAMSQNMPGMAGGGKLLANRAKAMGRFLARGPKPELPPRTARMKTAAATGAGLVGAKVAGDAVAERTGPGAKMNYRNMGKNAVEASMVNPLKFKYNDPSTWPKKARGGMLLKALKKPATAAGERWKGKLDAVRVQAPKRFAPDSSKGPALQTSTAQRLLQKQRVIMKNKNPVGFLNDHDAARRDYPGAREQEYKRWRRSTMRDNQKKVERLGSKYGATRREEIVDPWGFAFKARGGKLSMEAIKRLKPFRAKGKITPNDPPETMRYGGKFRARLKR